MLKLLRGGEVYAPEALGRKDVLIVGDKIAQIADRIELPSNFLSIEDIDVSGRIIAPGFIDYHNHMLGGGGGQGFASRTPPIQLGQYIRAGITTAVGALGFDLQTRQLEGLLGQAKTLEEGGLTTYIYAGGTASHPTLTFTGNIGRDMFLIDKVVGPGEVSLSEMGPALDSLGPGTEHIAQVAADAMLAGRLTGKSGLVCLQIPTVGRCLEPVFEIVEKTKIPASQFLASHSNTTEVCLLQAFDFAKIGGWCDVKSAYTARQPNDKGIPANRSITMALEAGVPRNKITMSTDGGGGLPVEDENGVVVGTKYLDVDTMHAQFRVLVREDGVDLTDALKFVSTNVAHALKLHKRKGYVTEGADADLLVLDKDLVIEQVYAMGKQMMSEGKVLVKGAWEHLLAGK